MDFYYYYYYYYYYHYYHQGLRLVYFNLYVFREEH